MEELGEGPQLPQFEGINQIDHYRLLGVGRGATQGQIQKAFRAKQLEYQDDDEGGTEELIQTPNKAYEVLTNDALRCEYFDTDQDFDDEDFIGANGALALNVGVIPSDRWKERIDLWRQEFSQLIIYDNFSQFFMELFANMDNIPQHDYFHCDLCDRDFVSSDEHYEMFLHSYLSRYDDDNPDTKDLGTTLRSHFGSANYDWKPRTYSNKLTGIWANENWTKFKKIETMMRNYFASKKKVEEINLEANPPEIRALDKIPASKLMTGRKKNPMDLLSLDQSREVNKNLKMGDEVRVVISSQSQVGLAAGESLPVISYKISSPAPYQKKKRCGVANCNSLLIFNRHHCRMCGTSLCSSCTFKWRYFELGLNRKNSSCRRCMLASAEMNTILWTEKAKELLAKDEFAAASLYFEIGVKYVTVNTSPFHQVLIEWGSLTDIAFKKRQYQIVHLLCSAMKHHFLTFSYWKSLCGSDNSGEEWAWALEFLQLKMDGPIWSEVFLKSFPSSHPEIFVACLKLEEVKKVSDWVDIAKRCYVELKAVAVSYSCISEARKVCKKRKLWNETVLDLFQQESYFQLAIWALRLSDRSNMVNIIKTLCKRNSFFAYFLVEKYMSAEFENWKPRLCLKYPVKKFEKDEDAALVSSMFTKFEKGKLKDCLVVAAYLAETERFNFKVGVDENLAKDTEMAIFCAKILKMSSKQNGNDTMLELGLALQARGEVHSARICFLEGNFDPVTLAGLFYDKGGHKSAIEYYSMSKNWASLIGERAAQLRQANNQVHWLYYVYLVKQLLRLEQNDRNVDQVVDIIFELFGHNQSKLDEIFRSLLARSSLEAPLLPSSRKIHENFITSRCGPVQNIFPKILSHCLAACHFLPTTFTVRPDFISRILPTALEANYRRAIDQNDFPLLGSCLGRTSSRLVGVVQNLLSTYLIPNCDIQSLPSPFKSQILLLQGIVALLTNKNMTKANQILHQALNAHPAYSNHIASCISRILQKENIHESLFSSMAREVSDLKNLLGVADRLHLSQFILICCPIFPREICQFAGFFSGDNPSITHIRKAEKEIRHRFHQNDNVEAACCYINLSRIAPDGASALACFQMAASYFLKAMHVSTDNRHVIEIRIVKGNQ